MCGGIKFIKEELGGNLNRQPEISRRSKLFKEGG